MSYTDFIYKLGDGILWTTDIIFENVGNIFNYGCVLLALVGMVYWLRALANYRREAAENPDILE